MLQVAKRHIVGAGKFLGVCAVSSMLFSVSHAGDLSVEKAHKSKSAIDYIKNSINLFFDNTNDFECEGGVRTAECRIDSYTAKDGIANLRNLRYTINQNDGIIYERITSDLRYNNTPYEDRLFMPTSMECMQIVSVNVDAPIQANVSNGNWNLLCNFKNESYEFNIRTNATISANIGGIEKKDEEALTLAALLGLVTKDLADQVYDSSASSKYSLQSMNIINMNLRNVNMSLSLLGDKERIDTTKFLTADRLGLLGFANYMSDYDNTAYASEVGRMIGSAKGDVLASKDIDERTKDSALRLLNNISDMFLNDSARTIYISFTHRDKDTIGLGDFLNALSWFNIHKTGNYLNKEYMNHYRLESGVSHFKALDRQ